MQRVKIEELLNDEAVWAAAPRGETGGALDILIEHPGTDFAHLYRLIVVREVWDVGVTLPATPGFEKAVRLGAALGLPIRVFPGQPSVEMLAALEKVAEFYLHDPMVEAPIEPFHWLFARLRGYGSGTIRMVLEDDLAASARSSAECLLSLPCPVSDHPASPMEQGGECAGCPWQEICGGYFKRPEPAYACAGVKHLFQRLKTAADEIGQDMAASQAASVGCVT